RRFRLARGEEGGRGRRATVHGGRMAPRPVLQRRGARGTGPRRGRDAARGPRGSRGGRDLERSWAGPRREAARGTGAVDLADQHVQPAERQHAADRRVVGLRHGGHSSWLQPQASLTPSRGSTTWTATPAPHGLLPAAVGPRPTVGGRIVALVPRLHSARPELRAVAPISARPGLSR